MDAFALDLGDVVALGVNKLVNSQGTGLLEARRGDFVAVHVEDFELGVAWHIAENDVFALNLGILGVYGTFGANGVEIPVRKAGNHLTLGVQELEGVNGDGTEAALAHFGLEFESADSLHDHIAVVSAAAYPGGRYKLVFQVVFVTVAEIVFGDTDVHGRAFG